MIKWKLGGIERVGLFFGGFMVVSHLLRVAMHFLPPAREEAYVEVYFSYACAFLVNFLLALLFEDWGMRDATISGALIALRIVVANFTLAYGAATHPGTLIAIFFILWIGHILASFGVSSAALIRPCISRART